MYTYKHANVTWCPCIKTKVCNNANPMCWGPDHLTAGFMPKAKLKVSMTTKDVPYSWEISKSDGRVTDSYFKVPLTVRLIGLYVYIVQSMQRGKNIT